MSDKVNFRTDIALPAKASGRRGPDERYPFDTLPAPKKVIGEDKKQVKDENGNPVFEYASFPTNRTAKKMQSTVYSATMRYATLSVDDKGNPVLNERGRKTYVKGREFKTFDVDPTTDPDGAVSRVFRVR